LNRLDLREKGPIHGYVWYVSDASGLSNSQPAVLYMALSFNTRAGQWPPQLSTSLSWNWSLLPSSHLCGTRCTPHRLALHLRKKTISLCIC